MQKASIVAADGSEKKAIEQNLAATLTVLKALAELASEGRDLSSMAGPPAIGAPLPRLSFSVPIAWPTRAA